MSTLPADRAPIRQGHAGVNVPRQWRSDDADAAKVVVCVDGSESSLPALLWAFRRALDRGVAVEVLTIWPPRNAAFIHEVPGHFCEPRSWATTAQRTLVSQALSQVGPAPTFSMRLENAPVVEAIMRAASTCRLLVLGTHADRGSAAPLGRLARRISNQAPCDVAVVDRSGDVRLTERSTAASQ